MHHARVAITPGAADAGAARPVGLVQQDPARGVERVPAALGQAVGDLLQPRLMRDRRPRVLLRPVALGRVLPVLPVHLIQLLGRRIPWLEVVVGQRPGRGDPVDVLDLPEVLGAQPVQGRAVHLGRPAHVVMDLRLERLAVPVEPGVLGDVPTGHKHRLGIPVLQLPGQEIPALQQQDPLPRRRQGVGQGAPARAGPNDDHVIVLTHDPTIATRRAPRHPPFRGKMARQHGPAAGNTHIGAMPRDFRVKHHGRQGTKRGRRPAATPDGAPPPARRGT